MSACRQTITINHMHTIVVICLAKFIAFAIEVGYQ